MLPQAVSDHYRAQQRLIVAALGLTRGEWSAMDLDNLDASWAKIAPRINLLTASAQLGAATNGARYVGAVLDEYGEDIGALGSVNPRAFAGVASDGRPLGSLLDGAVVRAKATNSLEVGGRWLDMAVHTQVADAGRGAASVAIAARPGVGWVRMVNPPSCGPCAVLAGREYRYNQGFQRHPRCDCVHIPTTLANPFDHDGVSPTLDQITDLSEGERKALLEGSDLSRVINARRGGGLGKMSTTELAKRGKVRLTPDGIFATAKDRTEALRLLKANGYIAPTARRVAATATRPTLVPPVRVAATPAKPALDLSGIRTAKTTQAVGDELQKTIGTRGKVSGFDGAALDLERTRSAAEQTARMFDRYPEVVADVKIVKLGKPYAQASGYRDGGDGSMKDLSLQISSAKLGKRSKVDEMFRRDAESGHFHAHGDTDPMTYIVSHEFGHLVDFAGRGQVAGSAPTPMALKVSAIKKRLLGDEGITNVNGREQFEWTKQNVSGYGQSNLQEMVAESFADVIINGDKAKPFSRLLHDEFVARLKERRG